MKRIFLVAGLLALNILSSSTKAATPHPVDTQASFCSAVKAGKPVKFHGRTLVEIPDITEPELRLVDRLLSVGCFDLANENFQAFQAANPMARNAGYIIARAQWMGRDKYGAQKTLDEVLKAHPDFASAKVLLAGLRYSDGMFNDTARLLDEVEPKSPQDLWVFMNRLRIEAVRNWSGDLLARLVEIARDPAFPPAARVAAADIGIMFIGQQSDEYGALLRGAFEADSAVTACKAKDLAMWLSWERGKYAETRQLLESPRATRTHCLSNATSRLLLAEAYIAEAVAISPRPSPKTERLVQRAAELVEGDFTELLRNAEIRESARHMQPFLAALVHPEEFDAAGNTPICNAIFLLKADVVAAQLDAGADPEGRCEGDKFSLVGSVIHQVTPNLVEKRKAVLRTLLEHGARPDKAELDACRGGKLGDCATVALPLIEQYQR
jgi:hypothetical protein